MKPDCPKCGYKANVIGYANVWRCIYCQIVWNKEPGQRKLTSWIGERKKIGNERDYK